MRFLACVAIVGALIPNFSITFSHVGDRVFDWLAEKKIIPLLATPSPPKP